MTTLVQQLPIIQSWIMNNSNVNNISKYSWKFPNTFIKLQNISFIKNDEFIFMAVK